MTGRILRVAVGLFVYVVTYLALRLLPNQAFAGYFNTAVQLAGDIACVILAFVVLRSLDSAWRGFFRAIGIASAFLLIANFAWGIVINVWAIDPNKTLEALAYRIPYLFCLVFWTLAWLELVVRQVNRRAGISLFLAAVLVGGALAALLVQYYGVLIFDSTNPHRVFVFLYVGLEIAALIFCTGAAIIEIHPYPVLIAVGYALLVAADFVFNTNELRDTVPQNSIVEIPWTVAQICVALGLSFQTTALAKQDFPKEVPESNVYAHFAIPLLSVILGSGLLGALIARFARPSPIALGCYLFGTAITAIAISALARVHTHAMARSLRQISNMTRRGKIEPIDPAGKEVLRLFGSAAVLNRVRLYLDGIRSQTVPCGWDRMFPIEDAWTTEREQQVFIAMPYTQPWSSKVDDWLRRVVADLGWSTLRADELFETRDVLAGIWKGVCESEFMVADLTARNPNVLYEVGIAHCLGKPVVFVCQQPDDIPFDLSTKRVVLYSLAELEQTTPQLRRALVGCSRHEDLAPPRQVTEDKPLTG